MADEIKVSVLMLAYNHEKYIDEAIRGIVLQKTNFKYELLIGNDASNDKTGEICQKWQEKYPDKIVLFNRETNIGFQQNFIHIYSQCRGKYMAVCEGDDYWCSRHKLQRQADFMDTHPDYSICFHRVVNYFEANKSKSFSNGHQKINTDILELAYSNYITTVSVFFRRKQFGELPEWFSQVSACDYALHLLNAQYGKIHFMKRPMAVYRQHRNGVWSQTDLDKKLSIAISIRELMMNHFLSQGNTAVYNNLLTAQTNIYISLLRYYRKLNATDKYEEVIAILQKKHPDWDKAHILGLVEEKNVSHSQKIRRWGFQQLKKCREILSIPFPLPRI